LSSQETHDKNISQDKQKVESIKEMLSGRLDSIFKNNSIRNLILAAGGVVAILAVVAIILFFNPFKLNAKSPVFYIKDKEINSTYLSPVKPFEITDDFIYTEYDPDDEDFVEAVANFDPVLLSKDGRHLFYFDRITDEGLASLYYRDLKNEKTRSNAIKIDSDIHVLRPIEITEGNLKLFYIKDTDNRFYYYNMDEKIKISSDVENFYVDKTGKYVVYIDTEGTIYEKELSGNDPGIKIDSNSYIYDVNDDLSRIYYTKDGSLYMKERGKDKVKLASDVSRVVSVIDGTGVYYMKTEQIKHKLEDYVIDDMLESDSSIKIPDLPSLDDYQEYKYVEDYWYGGYWDYETDWDAYNEAYEKYTEEMSRYEEKSERDNLRSALSTEEITSYNDILYFSDGTKETKISDDISLVIGRSEINAAILYIKYQKSAIEKIKLSEISSIDQARAAVEESNSVDNKEIYVARGSTEISIGRDNKDIFRLNTKGTRVYYLEDYEDSGTLYYIEIINDKPSSPVKVDEDVCSYTLLDEDDSIVYFKDLKDDSGDLYMDGNFIAYDVFADNLSCIEGSSSLIFYTDFSDKSYSGTLNLFKNNKLTKVADDVSFFVAVNNGQIVYLADYNMEKARGDAMLYNGSDKPVMVDTDITALIDTSKLTKRLW
jgi:hypothetical protein